MVTLSFAHIEDRQLKRLAQTGPVTVKDHEEHHAFAILGEDTLFASHLTMHCMGEHAYQFIIEVQFDAQTRAAFDADREAYPDETYFLANARFRDGDPPDEDTKGVTISSLAGGVQKFVGDVYRGWPKELGEHWPWDSEEGRKRVVFAKVEIGIRRIVHFRPFIANLAPPSTLLYLLFGDGEEAHMVNLQFRFPDFDHILSLAQAPDWLAKDILKAGAIFDLPDEPREKPQGFPVRCDAPFKAGDEVKLRYRARAPEGVVEIGRTAFFSTQVSNLGGQPNYCPHGP